MICVKNGNKRGKNKSQSRARGRDNDKMAIYGADENYDRNSSEHYDLQAVEYARCKRLY